MKFNVKRTQIKVTQVGSEFYVEHWGILEPLIQDPRKPLTLEQLKDIFEPANCIALHLVDPDHDQKVIEKSGRKDVKYYEGEKDEKRRIQKIQRSSSSEGS